MTQLIQTNHSTGVLTYARDVSLAPLEGRRRDAKFARWPFLLYLSKHVKYHAPNTTNKIQMQTFSTWSNKKKIQISIWVYLQIQIQIRICNWPHLWVVSSSSKFLVRHNLCNGIPFFVTSNVQCAVHCDSYVFSWFLHLHKLYTAFLFSSMSYSLSYLIGRNFSLEFLYCLGMVCGYLVHWIKGGVIIKFCTCENGLGLRFTANYCIVIIW